MERSCVPCGLWALQLSRLRPACTITKGTQGVSCQALKELLLTPLLYSLLHAASLCRSTLGAMRNVVPCCYPSYRDPDSRPESLSASRACTAALMRSSLSWRVLVSRLASMSGRVPCRISLNRTVSHWPRVSSHLACHYFTQLVLGAKQS